MPVDIIDSGKSTAEQNMAIDAELLHSLNENSVPILHFYEWLHPCATYGYFSSPSTLLNETGVSKYKLELAKRPTGGGIIFHQFDFAFSLLLPAAHPHFSLNTLDNYRYVNQIIAQVIQRFLTEDLQLELLACETDCSAHEDKREKSLRSFCMAKPTVYDVVYRGCKMAGGAQRRTKYGFLHQASIALTLPPDEFLAEVLPNPAIAAAMKKSSFPLLKGTVPFSEQENAKIILKNHLTESFYLDFAKSSLQLTLLNCFARRQHI